ncbi:MAG TPA: class I SAM-dependent methyltransferase [Candidatus Limnocylindria bacterium]|nr:class I SAM-dependent methyltransferase [Candidatus Limnocylindria bacterium]
MSQQPTTAEETPPAEAAYDGYATDYRDWWAPVIAPAAGRLLDRLDGRLTADARATLVDIGTGTGTLALAALRRWPRARVIGVDPARRLLEMAEAEARAAGLAARLEVRVGDAASLPLDAGSADIAMSSFVLQLVPNRLAAVREAFRVLRPGGSFACLTWRADEDPFEPEDVFDDVLEDLHIEPPKRSPGRGRSYTSPASASAEFRRAGFRSVHAREEWLEHRFTPASYVDVAEHWTEEDTFASLDEPMRQGLRAEVVRRLGLLHPDRLVWRRPLVSVVGKVPEAGSAEDAAELSANTASVL